MDWGGDLPDYTYEAFTYTNIGGMYDVGYQYYNGDISGYSAAGQMAMAGLGVRGLYKGYTNLTKHYASLEQLGSSGKRIAGYGTNSTFRNSQHYANSYGGDSMDWVKMSSGQYTARDNVVFETHWVQNINTGQRVNAKTKIIKGL